MKDEVWLYLMEVGKKTGCHQMPERSFGFKGYQFPVCARCMGAMISGVIACFLFVRKKRLPVKSCVLLSATMFADWMIQFIGIKESNNFRRFVTGLFGGLGFMTLHMHLYLWTIRQIIKIVKK